MLTHTLQKPSLRKTDLTLRKCGYRQTCSFVVSLKVHRSTSKYLKEVLQSTSKKYLKEVPQRSISKKYLKEVSQRSTSKKYLRKLQTNLQLCGVTGRPASLSESRFFQNRFSGKTELGGLLVRSVCQL